MKSEPEGAPLLYFGKHFEELTREQRAKLQLQTPVSSPWSGVDHYGDVHVLMFDDAHRTPHCLTLHNWQEDGQLWVLSGRCQMPDDSYETFDCVAAAVVMKTLFGHREGKLPNMGSKAYVRHEDGRNLLLGEVKRMYNSVHGSGGGRVRAPHLPAPPHARPLAAPPQEQQNGDTGAHDTNGAAPANDASNKSEQGGPDDLHLKASDADFCPEHAPAAQGAWDTSPSGSPGPPASPSRDSTAMVHSHAFHPQPSRLIHNSNTNNHNTATSAQAAPKPPPAPTGSKKRKMNKPPPPEVPGILRPASPPPSATPDPPQRVLRPKRKAAAMATLNMIANGIQETDFTDSPRYTTSSNGPPAPPRPAPTATQRPPQPRLPPAPATSGSTPFPTIPNDVLSTGLGQAVADLQRRMASFAAMEQQLASLQAEHTLLQENHEMLRRQYNDLKGKVYGMLGKTVRRKGDGLSGLDFLAEAAALALTPGPKPEETKSKATEKKASSSHPKAELKQDRAADAKQHRGAASKPDSTPDAMPDSKPESHPDSRPDSQPGSKPDSQPDSKLDIQPGSNPDANPESNPDSQPAQSAHGDGAAPPPTGEDPSNRPTGRPVRIRHKPVLFIEEEELRTVLRVRTAKQVGAKAEKKDTDGSGGHNVKQALSRTTEVSKNKVSGEDGSGGKGSLEAVTPSDLGRRWLIEQHWVVAVRARPTSHKVDCFYWCPLCLCRVDSLPKAQAHWDTCSVTNLGVMEMKWQGKLEEISKLENYCILTAEHASTQWGAAVLAERGFKGARGLVDDTGGEQAALKRDRPTEQREQSLKKARSSSGLAALTAKSDEVVDDQKEQLPAKQASPPVLSGEKRSWEEVEQKEADVQQEEEDGTLEAGHGHDTRRNRRMKMTEKGRMQGGRTGERGGARWGRGTGRGVSSPWIVPESSEDDSEENETLAVLARRMSGEHKKGESSKLKPSEAATTQQQGGVVEQRERAGTVQKVEAEVGSEGAATERQVAVEQQSEVAGKQLQVRVEAGSERAATKQAVGVGEQSEQAVGSKADNGNTNGSVSVKQNVQDGRTTGVSGTADTEMQEQTLTNSDKEDNAFNTLGQQLRQVDAAEATAAILGEEQEDAAMFAAHTDIVGTDIGEPAPHANDDVRRAKEGTDVHDVDTAADTPAGRSSAGGVAAAEECDEEQLHGVGAHVAGLPVLEHNTVQAAAGTSGGGGGSDGSGEGAPHDKQEAFNDVADVLETLLSEDEVHMCAEGDVDERGGEGQGSDGGRGSADDNLLPSGLVDMKGGDDGLTGWVPC